MSVNADDLLSEDFAMQYVARLRSRWRHPSRQDRAIGQADEGERTLCATEAYTLLQDMIRELTDEET